MKNPERTPTNERTQLSIDTSFDQLIYVLHEGNIPIDEYGTGAAKTVEHLLNEIHEEESIISVDSKGTVHRTLRVVWIDVLCTLSNGQTYRLKEDRQEFKDGRTRKRVLQSSLGEKLKATEDANTTVYRAAQEELGIQSLEKVEHIDDEEETYVSGTYPGIQSTYAIHKYVAVIHESDFKPEGYVEHQSDKSNYYIWQPVD